MTNQLQYELHPRKPKKGYEKMKAGRAATARRKDYKNFRRPKDEHIKLT